MSLILPAGIGVAAVFRVIFLGSGKHSRSFSQCHRFGHGILIDQHLDLPGLDAAAAVGASGERGIIKVIKRLMQRHIHRRTALYIQQIVAAISDLAYHVLPHGVKRQVVGVRAGAAIEDIFIVAPVFGLGYGVDFYIGAVARAGSIITIIAVVGGNLLRLLGAPILEYLARHGGIRFRYCICKVGRRFAEVDRIGARRVFISKHTAVGIIGDGGLDIIEHAKGIAYKARTRDTYGAVHFTDC